MSSNIKEFLNDRTNLDNKECMIVYHSYFNQVSLQGFTKIDMDILFFIISRMLNKYNKVVKINISEMLKAIDSNSTRFKNKKRFLQNVESFFDKLQKSFIKNFIINGKTIDLYRITLFNISSHYENGVLEYINVKITPEAKRFFNNIEYSKVKFSLKEFVNLNSKYSKNIYRIMKQVEFSKSNSWIINAFTFENIMNIPYSSLQHSNKVSLVKNKIIFPALDEINKKNIFDREVKIETINDVVYKNKNKIRKLSGYKFYFE